MSAMQFEVTLGDGRKRDGSGTAEFMRIALDQLEAQLSELEWEIELYRYILAQPDPEKSANEYLFARVAGNGRMKSKRDAVAALGWRIP